MVWMILIWGTTLALIWWRLARIEALLAGAGGALRTALEATSAAEAVSEKALEVASALADVAGAEREAAALESVPASSSDPPSGQWVVGTETRALREGAGAVLAALLVLEGRLGVTGLATVGQAGQLLAFGRCAHITVPETCRRIVDVATWPGAQSAELRILADMILDAIGGEELAEPPPAVETRPTMLPTAPAPHPRGAA